MAGKLTKEQFRVQKLLEKFGYDAITARREAAASSELVQEWLGYIDNKQLYKLRQDVIQIADEKIAAVRRERDALHAGPTLYADDLIINNTRLENREQALIFMRNMMVEDKQAVFVQEALELFLIGIQRTHRELPNPVQIKTKINLVSKSNDPALQQQPDAVKFMYFPTEEPPDRRGIRMSPEIILDYAYYKSRQRDPGVQAHAKVTLKAQWLQVCQALTHGGMEEYYHAYQDFTPSKKQELTAQAVAENGSVEAMQVKKKELRKQRVAAHDPAQIRAIVAQLTAADPWERDAETFRTPLEPETDALSEYYMERVLKGRAGPPLIR